MFADKMIPLIIAGVALGAAAAGRVLWRAHKGKYTAGTAGEHVGFIARAKAGSDDFDSPFETQVCERLRARGHAVRTQANVNGYSVDLAVMDPRTGRDLLGIECDGAAYHSGEGARKRDYKRQKRIERAGWRITRIWSKDWWKDPDAEIKRIEAWLKEIDERG